MNTTNNTARNVESANDGKSGINEVAAIFQTGLVASLTEKALNGGKVQIGDLVKLATLMNKNIELQHQRELLLKQRIAQLESTVNGLVTVREAEALKITPVQGNMIMPEFESRLVDFMGLQTVVLVPINS